MKSKAKTIEHCPTILRLEDELRIEVVMDLREGFGPGLTPVYFIGKDGGTLSPKYVDIIELEAWALKNEKELRAVKP